MATETRRAPSRPSTSPTAPLRELNARLHALAGRADPQPARWRVVNPSGAHALAVGLDAAGRGRDRRATSATTAPA